MTVARLDPSSDVAVALQNGCPPQATALQALATISHNHGIDCQDAPTAPQKCANPADSLDSAVITEQLLASY